VLPGANKSLDPNLKKFDLAVRARGHTIETDSFSRRRIAMKKRIWLSLVLVIAMISPCFAGGETDADDSGVYEIGFVYPTLNNPFFVDQQAGSNQAGADFGARVIHVSGENDVNRQVQLVEDFIVQGVDAIILQAVDTAGVVTAIRQANEAGVPVFTPGESPAGGEVVTAAVFNEVNTGRSAAEYVLSRIDADAGAKVVMLLGIQGAETARNRQDGFETRLLEGCPACEIVAKQPAGFDRTMGLNVMEAVLQSQPEIDVVWAANDEMALGAIQAIKEAGRQDEMFVVGTDGIGDALTAIRNGDMAATYALPPYKQGYMITQTAIEHLNGTSVCNRIEEQGLLITSENIDDAEDLLKAVGDNDRYWDSCYGK
jgi:ribose transport system substrate-binding protein